MYSEDLNKYWTNRYEEAQTGWDIGYPSTPLKTYIDQLTGKNQRILIPGAGNAYEAEYLFYKGFSEVYIIDISEMPLAAFMLRNPEFPKDQIIKADFFNYEGQFDLILEQTFFCSFPPLEKTRRAYAKQMSKLLSPKGKLVGLWFDMPLTGDMEKRPFGGDKELYLKFLTPFFTEVTFERAYNSIPPRAGNELFGIFIKK